MNIKDVLLKAKPTIEWTYDRLCDVYNFESYEKPNGATGKRDVLSEENLKCRLSVKRLENTNLDDGNKLLSVQKLFTNPQAKITGGSRLVIGGVKYVLTQEPMIYDTHMEVLVMRNEWI